MHITSQWTVSFAAVVLGTAASAAQTVDLPSSKQLIGEMPGHAQRLNSLPISLAVSPDGRYIVTVNAGFGTFESKYGERVKVYSAGDFSKEICGGPHANNTGELGHFKIQKEESSSAGVRRIKAILS